jgi:hypothetical protein
LPKTLRNNDVSEIGGADTVQNRIDDAVLNALIEAWPTLPKDIKAAIIKLADVGIDAK